MLFCCAFKYARAITSSISLFVDLLLFPFTPLDKERLNTNIQIPNQIERTAAALLWTLRHSRCGVGAAGKMLSSDCHASQLHTSTVKNKKQKTHELTLLSLMCLLKTKTIKKSKKQKNQKIKYQKNRRTENGKVLCSLVCVV